MTFVATPAPEALGETGIRLWNSVAGMFVLEPHEHEMLRSACETADAIARLTAIVADEGDMAASSQGTRAHPALVEARQQRITLARQIAALRLPTVTDDPSADDDADDDAGPVSVPQRRAGVRGVYGVGGDR